MKEKTNQKQKRELFAKNYEQYYPLVFNIFYSKLNNADVAEDLSQEVFIKYYSKLDEVENPRKWLLGVLKNDLLNYYKRKHKDQIDVDLVPSDVSLQFVNGMRDTRIIIEEAITNVSMTDTERLIFEYISFYNYTQQNTAEVMGITRRKVLYTYDKVEKKILDYLSKKGIRNIEELL